MGGDKIVLLDGAGANGGGAATNGLLSMIPGMFANLIGGNKMDPNLVAALMNGRNNQDGFGGANGWWLWIIVLFWLWGGRGFGNGFGNGGDCCANGLPAQLNNDYGRELLMQAIQGNRSAIDQIASALNCSTTQLQNAICNVQGAIDKVAGQVGHREYPGYDEIEDRRGGGRGRSRRSDGTYMGYGGGIYDHYGMHEKMKEMEERENELEERERRLEERERRHEMEDREYRRMGYESYPTDYYGDDRYYGDGPQMRRGRGRGRGRSY